MDLLLLAMKDRYAFSICLQLLGAKPPDPMFILGIHGGNIPPILSGKKRVFIALLKLSLQLVAVCSTATKSSMMNSMRRVEDYNWTQTLDDWVKVQ